MPLRTPLVNCLTSQSFLLALLLCLTAQHLPSPLEAAFWALFLILFWQLRPKSKGAAVGLSLAVHYSLVLTLVLFLKAFPKASAWLEVGSEATRVPAQLGAYAPILGGVGSLILVIVVGLLRYYEANETSSEGVRLRFATASTVLWGSLVLAGERILPPNTNHGYFNDLPPLVSTAILIAFPASFVLWRLGGGSWWTRCLRAFGALFLIVAGFYTVVIVSHIVNFFPGFNILSFPIYLVAISVASRLPNAYNLGVAALWAGTAAYVRGGFGSGPRPYDPKGHLLPLVPLLLCAVSAFGIALSLNIHNRGVAARKEAEALAAGTRRDQKLAALMKWRVALPSLGVMLSPPVSGPDNSVYIIGRKQHILHAFDSSGHMKWSFPGVISAEPAVGTRGAVYVVGAGNTLYALDEHTGNESWSKTFSNDSEWICSGPALAADGTIYILTQPSAHNLNLSAFSPEGRFRWRVTKPSQKMCSIEDALEMPPQLLPAPVVSEDGTIYFAHESTLYAIDPIGTEKWSAPTEGPLAGVLTGKNGQVYTYAAHLMAFDAKGELQWTSSWDTQQSRKPSVGVDGTVYCRCFHESSGIFAVVAFNQDGSEKWTFSDGSVDGTVAAPDGNVYVSNGSPLALSAQGQKLDWGGFVFADDTPAVGPDGTVYFANYDNDLYALNPPHIEKQLNPQALQ